MPTAVRLDPAVEARLDRLAQVTGRSKAYYLRELIAVYTLQRKLLSRFYV